MSVLTSPPVCTMAEADFFAAVIRAEAGNPDPGLIRAGGLGMNQGVDSQGGFLCPPTFTDRIISKAYATGEILRRTTDLEVGAYGKVFTPTMDESSRADGSRFGGMRVYRVDEGGALTGSLPKVAGQIRELHKLLGACYVTDEMVEDAPLLVPYLERVASLALAYRAEDDVVNGNRAGQALGLLNSGCKIVVDKAENQTAATVWGPNIKAMVARLWGPSFKSAVWLFNQELLDDLSSLSDAGQWGSESTSTGDAPPLWDWGVPGGYPRLAGRPAIPCEYCAAPGTSGDLVLTDLSEYGVALKAKFQVSTHVRFLANESVFVFGWRFDGAPPWASALTPDNGTDTLSPIVTLADRD